MKFSEKKTIQAAAYLIKKQGGGAMKYMKLLKLLYLADRTALIDLQQPITFDQFCAMDHGMVLSETLDLINKPSETWRAVFQRQSQYDIALIDQDPGVDDLSRAEIKILDQVFKKYGHFDRWKLREITHELPEWNDPQGSSKPVEISEVLRLANKTTTEIKAIEDDLESISSTSALFDE